MSTTSRWLLPLTVSLAIVLTGCPTGSTCKTIPVPQQDSRSEKLNLPLSDSDAANLLRHLRYGLSKEKEANRAMVDANADQTYGARLDLLKKRVNKSALHSSQFKQWLPYHLIMNVDDPGDAASSGHRFAANDGTYFWIFYTNGDQLTQVLVVKVTSCENLKETSK